VAICLQICLGRQQNGDLETVLETLVAAKLHGKKATLHTISCDLQGFSELKGAATGYDPSVSPTILPCGVPKLGSTCKSV
jgi:hypothetical protein